jgi:hypothetical protein
MKRISRPCCLDTMFGWNNMQLVTSHAQQPTEFQVVSREAPNVFPFLAKFEIHFVTVRGSSGKKMKKKNKSTPSFDHQEGKNNKQVMCFAGKAVAQQRRYKKLGTAVCSQSSPQQLRSHSYCTFFSYLTLRLGSHRSYGQRMREADRCSFPRRRRRARRSHDAARQGLPRPRLRRHHGDHRAADQIDRLRRRLHRARRRLQPVHHLPRPAADPTA